jgi:hypothetical protein
VSQLITRKKGDFFGGSWCRCGSSEVSQQRVIVWRAIALNAWEEPEDNNCVFRHEVVEGDERAKEGQMRFVWFTG